MECKNLNNLDFSSAKDTGLDDPIRAIAGFLPKGRISKQTAYIDTFYGLTVFFAQCFSGMENLQMLVCVATVEIRVTMKVGEKLYHVSEISKKCNV